MDQVNENKETREEFLAVAIKIKNLGYRVFLNNKSKSFGFFSDGKSIGYFQKATYSGVDIYSHGRRGENSPSGFQINDGKPYSLKDITPQELQKAFVLIPKGNKLRKYQHITPYKDVEDFLNNYWDKNNLVEI